MVHLASDPEVYPDFLGEPDPESELTALHLSLLRQIDVQIPHEKPKKKGSRSRPKRGHKKNSRNRKSINHRK